MQFVLWNTSERFFLRKWDYFLPLLLIPFFRYTIPVSPPPLFLSSTYQFIFQIISISVSPAFERISLSLESAFRSYKGRHKNTRQPARSRRLGVRHLRGRVKGEMEKGRQSKFPFPRITFPSFHIKISPEHFTQIRPSHLCLRVREESRVTLDASLRKEYMKQLYKKRDSFSRKLEKNQCF